MEGKLTYSKYPFLKELGLEEENQGCFNGEKWEANGEWVTSVSPTTGEPIARVREANVDDYKKTAANMEAAKKEWMGSTFAFRGEVMRQIGEEFRKLKDAFGSLLSLEMGKIISEGKGEVQEVIDVCDMACGLSRTLNGLVIPSERPDHFMMERWHPLGVIGVITAFNFPCAVYGWNLSIAAVCGNLLMLKGSPTVPLMQVALIKMLQRVLKNNGVNPAVLTVCQGNIDVGNAMVEDPRMKLISFTGSTAVGRIINKKVAERFGRAVLELSGNAAMIVCDDANQELALKASLFAAVGTAGQRCTTLRRLLVQENIYDEFVAKLAKCYPSIPIGDPLDSKTLVGPLHNKQGVQIYQDGVKRAQEQGGKIGYGGKVLSDRPGNFVEPCFIEVPNNAPILKEELFCPILFVTKFKTVDEAIEMNNSVPQGLSSAMFTNNVQNTFKWTGPLGSDCGLANVNIGSSGAEIGGAFGGEKETGGGRESGSDAWKQYMRRQTCTINYGTTLPLAQGVEFNV